MKILYVPMDERPCNAKFPHLIARGRPDIELLAPPLAILGDKKQPADVDAVWTFVNEAAWEADFAVLSLDMLYYGGLIPSRLHHLSEIVMTQRINLLRQLHDAHPTLKILAFESIMRSPSHDTAEEEPDYYGEYGRALHRRAYLADKASREMLTDAERTEANQLTVPDEIIADYEKRRAINLGMNVNTLQLLDDGVLELLVFPQDDSAPYGYTAIGQKAVLDAIHDKHLAARTRIYPGSDEVGCSLVARAYMMATGKAIKVYPYFASTMGPQVIPLYEDRPMQESLKSHLEVTGLTLVSSLAEADCLLAINSPGKVMIEAPAQANADITYATFRNLVDFVAQIRIALTAGKQVAVCDSAYTNGGDLELFDRLKTADLADQVCAYAGWNTNCNTLGTTLGTLILNYDLPQPARQANLVYRYIEDILFQSDVRQAVLNDVLPQYGATYFDLAGHEADVYAAVEAGLNDRLSRDSLLRRYRVKDVILPWRRMFEINFALTDSEG